MRPSPTSDLFCRDKWCWFGRSEAELDITRPGKTILMLDEVEFNKCFIMAPFIRQQIGSVSQQTITQKMVDQERSDFYVVFTMTLCGIKSLQMLITLLSELISLSNQKLMVTEVVGSMEAPSKAFLLFFLRPDWLKLNHLKSRMEFGFSDIFPAIFVPQ